MPSAWPGATARSPLATVASVSRAAEVIDSVPSVERDLGGQPVQRDVDAEDPLDDAAGLLHLLRQRGLDPLAQPRRERVGLALGAGDGGRQRRGVADDELLAQPVADRTDEADQDDQHRDDGRRGERRLGDRVGEVADVVDADRDRAVHGMPSRGRCR